MPQLSVFYGGTCVQVETSEDGNVATGIRIKDDAGRESRLNASRIVIAAGGIETPRLLLASTTARSCGIGNETDNVGRFYMTHLGGSIGDAVFADPNSHSMLDYRLSSDGIYCRRLLKLSERSLRRSNSVNVVFRAAHPDVWDPAHGKAVLSAMFMAKRLIAPEYRTKLDQKYGAGSSASRFWTRHAWNIVSDVPALFRFSADWARRRIFASRKLPSVFLESATSVYPFEYDAEHLPCFDSRISIGTERDRFGMPRVRIDWKVSQSNFEGLVSGCIAFKRALAAAGIAKVQADDSEIGERVRRSDPVGGHHIGTVRMGADRSQSVVNSQGEVWRTKNLFIAGSAVFPTSSFANPTLTAVALAFRQADFIASSFKRRPL
jgi:choline dehydrogenase-like flavoprotein